MTPLERTDPAFAPGAPPQGATIPAWWRPVRGPAAPAARQDDPGHPDGRRGAFIRRRGEPGVGDGQSGRTAEERAVALQRRPPERLVRHTSRAHLIVSNDLALGLLDLHDLAELGRLRGLALADCFGVGLEDAEHLVGECVSPWRMRARACAPDAADALRPLKDVAVSVRDRQQG